MFETVRLVSVRQKQIAGVTVLVGVTVQLSGRAQLIESRKVFVLPLSICKPTVCRIDCEFGIRKRFSQCRGCYVKR